mgnify:FL=1
MSFRTRTALFVALTLTLPATFNSCVNEDYDLTKDIDKTICIDGEISAPIGNSETIFVTDLLNLDGDESDVLFLDINDNYVLTFMGNRTEASFTVPSFRFSGDIMTNGGHLGLIKRSDIMEELAPGLSGTGLPVPKGLTVKRTFDASTTPLEIDEDIPEEVTDVKDIHGNAVAKVTFLANTGKATLSGLTVDFPDYLIFAGISKGQIDCDFDKESNTLRFGQVEVGRVMSEVSLDITGIDLTKIPAGQGFIRDRHKMLLNDNITLTGFEVSLLTDDLGNTFGDIPEEVHINTGIKLNSLDIKDVTVKVDPKVAITPQAINVGKLPDFVNGDGAVLDLYDPQIMLFLGNDSPLTMSLNADLESYKGASRNTVHIGDNGGATDKITVKSGMTSRIYLSRTGESAPSGYQNVKVSNLSDIVKNVPERISIANIDVKADDEFVTVQTDKSYNFYCSYSIIAPLAFGKDMRIDYCSDYDGWNEIFNSEDVDYEINSAVVTFDCVNTIPFGIEMTAAAIDKEDNVIPEITVTIEGNVSSGSVDKPSKTPMTLNLKTSSGDDMRRLDGIRMNNRISGADNDLSGVCLNKRQSIKLENMKIKIKGAINTEL